MRVIPSVFYFPYLLWLRGWICFLIIGPSQQYLWLRIVIVSYMSTVAFLMLTHPLPSGFSERQIRPEVLSTSVRSGTPSAVS